MASKNLIRFDWAMKRLLRNKADYTVLEGFLSELLDEDIKIININESESNQRQEDDKFNRVDILVENSSGELVIIEMQNNSEVDYLLRMLYGVSKVVSEQLKKGDRYGKIRKIYHINIVYFRLGDGEDYVYRGVADFRGIHHNNVLKLTDEQKKFFVKENVEDIFPEYYILCVRDFNDFAKNSLDEWIYYLKNTEIPDNFTARGLEEARKQLLYDNLSDEEKKAYDHHVNQTRYEQNVIEDAYASGHFEGEIIGLEKGEAIGLEKGEAIGLEKVVINSNRAGYSIEAISAITGLTQEEIARILERETT
ncbi:MAG: Rpn family recombination-promoting nuclease/putative transposase [Lentimicrobiaceae bacterium]|nr:Rpn family recombination-promoting nuclease/putative transposase [Lentimicrobiaceae bacterium]